TRFAAKEAFSKAIGLGMHWPMTWRAMELLNLPSGEPHAHCHGELAQWLSERGLTVRVSVSDEHDYAVAFAIAERTGPAAASAV
ncbi:holo-ACP synthase, partial [Acinetobacter baumannii]